jgi:soluble lytic murein transglycosylase
MHESGFDETIKSPAGAVGLMQVTPETAEGIAKRTGGAAFKKSDLLNPEINIRYGCWYLQHLHKSFGKGDGEDYVATLAAYNAGQGRVREWLKDDDDGRLDIDEIPFAETRAYARKVTRTRGYYRRAYADELGL